MIKKCITKGERISLERMEHIGGNLKVKFEPCHGFQITTVAPLKYKAQIIRGKTR